MTTSTTRPTLRLVVDGGTPVRSPQRRWPEWPVPAPGAEQLLTEALHSRRWAISSPSNGADLFERRFARRFAQYVGAAHCVPVDHGSSALVVALEALGIPHGETVLVPALTWTASATAVLRAGLVPMLVDVDPATGCVRPQDLDLDVGAAALVAVHWASVMADVPALEAVAGPAGLAIVEDVAQAHGATWQGRQAGTLGRLGCFSFQNGKVLTGGEGGAVVTDDAGLACTLEELRADSRRYRDDATPRGELDLEESAGVQGANFCLSEFSAAVLCAQLDELDAQHETRNRNYALLTELLAEVEGVRLLQPPPAQTRMSIYEATVVFDALPADVSTARLGEALTAELGRRFYPTDAPLHRSPLLQPGSKAALGPLAERFVELHRGRTYPGCDQIAGRCVQTHHSTFLGDGDDMQDIAAAVTKVRDALVRPR
ncbi:DegT/DnrJ/EryC1/StrS family aminotransferase [Cellulomonas wangsupingiae]|uniref:DegT/DnrJ/EryC1/StrS family aminotransferase n=1 Tax=Cellulomonas wangsupingiae TaxID=2968085 RepID=A0ABY5KCB6_9CELL|nr:DegT/DnrJ/EryC1/StrS family aminotransferase [Cellulomonas wangsupingiae]MCC2333041.1 DegT/DnrJ/EryC1/StrS family aminotransferase [Cellulomonas wangsupingiae]UUI66757.1 DegT/DnrJ/EryC1/StrS family aminotransferase [Cellulomonas wangsupingiae]